MIVQCKKNRDMKRNKVSCNLFILFEEKTGEDKYQRKEEEDTDFPPY